MNRLELKGRLLARALISSVTDSTGSRYSEILPRKRVVEELLVMCELPVGMIATGLPVLKPLWTAIQDELAQFDPGHLDLLDARLSSYFDCLGSAKGAEIIEALVSTVAGHIGSDIASLAWASEALSGWIAALGEMVPDNADVL